MNFDSEVGQDIVDLIKYWQELGEDPDYRLSKLIKGAPSFNSATKTEKKFLEAIMQRISVKQLNNLYDIVDDAYKYIEDKNKRNLEEYNLIINKQRVIEAEEKRLADEAKKKKWEEEEKNRIKKERQEEKRHQEIIRKAEERIRAQQEEEQKQLQNRLEEERRIRQLQEELSKKQKEERREKTAHLEKIFHQNFLESRQIWQEKLSDRISEEEFAQMSCQYIVQWFETQCWQKPDPEQALCIAEIWDDIQVIARAGSGKTSTIVNRAAFLVKHCKVSPSEILILAFNREAAKELDEKLNKMLPGNKPSAMTFHALAHALVHPEEELIFDDEKQGFTKSRSIQQVIDSYIKDPVWSAWIRKLMLKYFRSDWLDIEMGGYHLDPEKMVEYRRLLPYIGLDGYYYKSMGEKRIANYLFEHDVSYLYEKNFWWGGLNYKPDFTIPLKNGPYKGIVIEYFGMTGLDTYDHQTEMKKKFWSEQSDYLFISLFPDDVETNQLLDQRVGKPLKKCKLGMQKLTDLQIWHRIRDRAVDEFSKTVSQFIGRCRKQLIYPDDLKAIINNNLQSLSELQIYFLKLVWNIYSEYLRLLVINNEEDFDGLLIRAEELIKNGHSGWHRKAGSGDLKQIKHLFIDEYQDFSLLFYRLVSAVRDINPDVKLFCVGDDWQAINGFAGSDLRFFREFNSFFENAKKLTITSNRRSTKEVVRVCNELMKAEGVPSKCVSPDLGEVHLAYINDFIPTNKEKEIYPGDLITPALIRVVNSLINEGKHIALLCRRRGGLPWYTPYKTDKGGFFPLFINEIRKALPENKRSKVVAMDTVHSYKGKEEEVIIVVDAVQRSFPLIHPRYIFFRVLGYSIEEIVSEEKRLFYVALSRSKNSLVIMTEKGMESPFLKNDIQKNVRIKTLDINKLPPPKRKGTHYEICVYNTESKNQGTYDIKSYLQENGYCWDAARKFWVKHISAEVFSKDNLLKESWIEMGSNISISIDDEFENCILLIEIDDGVVISIDEWESKKN
ncbi:MAG: UvrD-helicase domain-containing protein [Desulfitobacteriaceae bacterium]|nr:UvrD-helicase domain-containing protein [Desulfitobacteriaceae bacterium]